MFRYNKKGSLLIYVLWTLSLLTFFAVNLGVRIRQDIMVLSRLDKRDRLHHITSAGIQRAFSVLFSTEDLKDKKFTVRTKVQWHNNPYHFRNVKLDWGHYDVFYNHYESDVRHFRKMFGFIDEERKININKIDLHILQELCKYILKIGEDEALEIARAIVSWREYGETEIEGFFSNEYYENLEFPYPEKKKNFESLDELLMVRGITDEIYHQLFDFVTIYGAGQVNINTAPQPVLQALGFDEKLSEKILRVRRGPDGIEYTRDDRIFNDVQNLSAMVNKYEKLNQKEVGLINKLGSIGRFTTRSSFYMVQAQASLQQSQENRRVTCVFDTKNERIIYWKEY